MHRGDFEAMVHRMAGELAPEFLEGVTDVTVTGKTVPHPLREGVWTLGECVPHHTGGPDDEGPTLRSRVLLHYGSFRALAAERDDFDWRTEAWETLTHEVRHHLEWRARAGALEAFDEAVEANYARHDGEAFPPLFYFDGERVDADVYKVEDDVFLDRSVGRRQWRALPGSEVTFVWHGRRYGVHLPATLPDILLLSLRGVEPPPAGDLVLVIRRRPGAFDWLRRTAVGQEEAVVTSPPAR